MSLTWSFPDAYKQFFQLAGHIALYRCTPWAFQELLSPWNWTWYGFPGHHHPSQSYLPALCLCGPGKPTDQVAGKGKQITFPSAILDPSKQKCHTTTCAKAGLSGTMHPTSPQHFQEWGISKYSHSYGIFTLAFVQGLVFSKRHILFCLVFHTSLNSGK